MENRRRYIRFINEETQVVTFQKGGQVFSALLENESYNSLSAVYIGQKEISKGDILIWLEGENVSTKVKVIRNQELSENVFKLALQTVH